MRGATHAESATAVKEVVHNVLREEKRRERRLRGRLNGADGPSNMAAQ